jgi:hypothetical protein
MKIAAAIEMEAPARVASVRSLQCRRQDQEMRFCEWKETAKAEEN